MKNKKLLLLSIIFAAIIISAVFLYNTLSPGVKQELDNLESIPAPSNSPAVNDSVQSDNTWTRIPGQSAASGFPAPDFTVLDAAGSKHKLSEYKGKPVVINFWTSWCPYCKDEMPLFEEAYNSFGSTVQFMMIDAVDGRRETFESGKEYIDEYEYTFPVFYDASLEAVNGYGIQAFPSTFFIDKDGNIAATVQGKIDPAALKKYIEQINK